MVQLSKKKSRSSKNIFSTGRTVPLHMKTIVVHRYQHPWASNLDDGAPSRAYGWLKSPQDMVPVVTALLLVPSGGSGLAVSMWPCSFFFFFGLLAGDPLSMKSSALLLERSTMKRIWAPLVGTIGICAQLHLCVEQQKSKLQPETESAFGELVKNKNKHTQVHV